MKWGKILDGVQLALDVAGMVPGLGEVCDGVNGLISLGRGDLAGAALSFAAMVPLAGNAATAMKFAKKLPLSKIKNGMKNFNKFMKKIKGTSLFKKR